MSIVPGAIGVKIAGRIRLSPCVCCDLFLVEGLRTMFGGWITIRKEAISEMNPRAIHAVFFKPLLSDFSEMRLLAGSGTSGDALSPQLRRRGKAPDQPSGKMLKRIGRLHLRGYPRGVSIY